MDEIYKLIDSNKIHKIKSKYWEEKLPNSSYLIHYLAERNDTRLISICKKNPKLTMLRDNKGRLVTHILAQKRYYTLTCKCLKELKISPQEIDSKHNTCLHYLCDVPNAVKQILKYKMNIDIRNRDGLTPLLVATLNNSFKSFKLLLENKANPEAGLDSLAVFILICNNDETTALKWLKLAHKYKCDLNRVSPGGETAIAIAFENKYTDVIDFLIENNVDFNKGYPPLLFTLLDMQKYTFIRKYAHKFDFTVRDHQWNTCLHYYLQTCTNIQKDVCVYLVENLKKSNINDQNIHGNSIYHLIKSADVLELLVNYLYMDVNLKNANQVSVWDHIKSFPNAQKCLKKSVGVFYPKFLKKQKKDLPQLTRGCTVIKPPSHTNHIYSSDLIYIPYYIIYIYKRYQNNIFISTKKDMTVNIGNDIHSKMLKRSFRETLKYVLSCNAEFTNFGIFFNKTTYCFPKLEAKYPNKLSFYFIFTRASDTNMHTNILIIDPKQKIIERFDPEGYKPAYTEMNNVLKEIFLKHPQFKSFKYMWCYDCYNEYKYQLLEESNFERQNGDPGGFCTMWCIWYLELRLIHPTVPPKQLYADSIKKLLSFDQSLRDYIRDYSIMLTKIKDQMSEKHITPIKAFTVLKASKGGKSP
uniref:Ankyrin repeat containing protein n=1 Tax=Megaviridae environmental sample TaxID=1737588 RepID=A0A5J6VIE7_9VIRU|nr:MAG: ankyrin repeat containing protein [Megaviridae environmental sample]